MEAILEAAEEVFGDVGVHGAKVEQIASRAGVSVGTLYNHFDDRDALLQALWEARKGDFVELLQAEFERTDLGFRAHLESLVGLVFEMFSKHRRFFHILFQSELEERQREGKEKRSALHPPPQRAREAIERLYQHLSEIMHRGVEEGAVSPAVVDIAPTLLLGMVRGMLMRALYNEKLDVRTRAADVVRVFLDGAGKRHV